MVKKKDQTTEEKILAAAKQVFVKKGMTGARMQDIADTAGINKALLHYYFRSKEKLFEVIFKEAATRLFPKINEILNSDLPLFDKIHQFTHDYVEMVIETPYLPLFVLNEINKQPHEFSKKMFGKNRPPVHKLAEQIEKAEKKINKKIEMFKINIVKYFKYKNSSKILWFFIEADCFTVVS